jgi:hypothetical protein
MNAEANIGGSIMRCIDVKSDQLCLNLVDKHLAWFLLIAMRFLRLVKSKFLMFLLGALCLLEALAMTGCVYPVGGAAVAVGPPPLLPGPVVSVGFYGTPAGYFYRDRPVYIHRGRPAYYVGPRRYYFRPGPRYHYRRGYRYYY